jgi:hypothetical protein
VPPRDQPLQVYFASCRIRLIVRLEDFGAPSTPVAPSKPTTLRKGVTSKNDKALKVQVQDGAFVLVGPGDDPSHIGSPQQQQSSGDGLTHVLDGVIPQTAELHRNGIRTASQCSFTLQFADLPIDPRVVRSCAVQFFMGCVSADDYERGLNGAVRPPVPGASVQIPNSVVPDGYTDEAGRPRTNLRFEGWVDEWSAEFPEGDAPLLKFECTDNTRLLIDEDAPPKLVVGTDQPIDLAFANYLANFPQFRGLSVEYQPSVDRSKIPVLKTALKATAFQPKLGPAPSGGGTSKLKVWDYLSDVAGSLGHVLRFVGTRLIVQLPRTMYNARLPTRQDDPFTGRHLPSGAFLKTRLYLYGENISEMKYGRKFAQFAPMNVEVRSFDPTKKTTLVVRFPQKGDRVKRIQPGESSEEKWVVHRVSGIGDLVTLRVVAQSIYEQLGRRELGVTVVTKNLGSYGGGNLDPDMFDADVGDPIDVKMGGQLSLNNTVLDIQDQMVSRPERFLTDLGFPPAFASAYAKAVSGIGLPYTYRIRNLSFQWDSSSDSVTIQSEMTNYVEVRADKELPAGEEIEASQVRDTPPPAITVYDQDLGAGI